MNPDFGYLLGIYLGDGCVYGTPRTFQLRGIDRDILDHTKSLLNNYFGCRVNVNQVGENLWGVSTSKESAVDFFYDACGKNPKNFPLWFHEQSPAFKYELLAGLLDTDGYTSYRTCVSPTGRTKSQITIGFCSTSDWICDVKILAESFGIKVGLPHVKHSGQKQGHKGKKIVLGINLNVSDFIKNQCFFRCNRKQARVLMYAERYGLEYPHRPYAKHHLLTQV